MWITNLINDSKNTYNTYNDALQQTINIIAAWAHNNNMDACLYTGVIGNKRKTCNRVLSIKTQTNRGYDYKLTIHHVSDGYQASLIRLNNTGFSFSTEQVL